MRVVNIVTLGTCLDDPGGAALYNLGIELGLEFERLGRIDRGRALFPGRHGAMNVARRAVYVFAVVVVVVVIVVFCRRRLIPESSESS